jgi:SAP domain
MPDYGKKTVVELQEILKGRSLPHTGKKAELVARLNEADKSDETKQGMCSIRCLMDLSGDSLQSSLPSLPFSTQLLI